MSAPTTFDISQTDSGLKITSNGKVPVIIPMATYGYPQLTCVTTIAELKDARVRAAKEKRNDLFYMMISVKRALGKSYAIIAEVYEEQGERWDNMMSDCLLLAVQQETLFKREIPIQKITSMRKR